MDWAQGVGLGAVVGIAGGFWLMLSLLYIRLSFGKPWHQVAAAVSSLLTLPVFEGGSTWLASSLFASIFDPAARVAYLFSSLTLIIAINLFPAIKLIAWTTGKMEVDHVIRG